MSKRPYIVGELKGYPVGSTWANRKDLAESGVHRSVRRGIDWGVEEPACSIVLSAGYSIDNDMGKIVIYSGEGGGLDPSCQGRDKQIRDQEWKRGNAALLRACKEGSPVRLIRSCRSKSSWAPREGLRYDGLYTVTKADLIKSKAGLETCVFKLISQPGQGPIPRQTGYGSITMYESSDMEDSEKEEDQLDKDEYQTPPSKRRPISILDLPLDSDSESDEKLITPKSYKATQKLLPVASSSKRTLDVIEFSSNSEDEVRPSPSKKRKTFPFGPKTHRIEAHRRNMVLSSEVIEILDTDEEQESSQSRKMPLSEENGDLPMSEDLENRELRIHGEIRKVQGGTHRSLLSDQDDEDVEMLDRVAPNENLSGLTEGYEKKTQVANSNRCSSEVTDGSSHELDFVRRPEEDQDVKEEDQDITIAIAEFERANALVFAPERSYDIQERIVIDLTGDD